MKLDLVTKIHQDASDEMGRDITFNHAKDFIESPSSLRAIMLFELAQMGVNGEFHAGYSNFLAKLFYDYVETVHYRMEAGEFISLEEVNNKVNELIKFIRKRSDNLRIIIEKMSQEVAGEPRTKTLASLNSEDEKRVGKIMSQARSNYFMSEEGDVLVIDKDSITESEFEELQKLLHGVVKKIGRITFTDDGEIEIS